MLLSTIIVVLLTGLLFFQPYLFVAGMCILLFVLGFRYPKQALFLFLFYAAFYYWYYALWGARGVTNPRLIDESVFAKLFKDVLVLSVYAFCLGKVLVTKKIRFDKMNFLLPLLGFVGIAVIQGIRGMGDSIFLGLIALRNFILYVPVVFVVPMLVTSKKDIKDIIKYLIFGAIIVSLIGVYEYFFGGISFYHQYSTLFKMFINRIYSTLYNTNNFAIYLNIFIMLCFSFYLNRIYIINKQVSLTILVLFSFCLLATQSRVGLAMFLMGIVFLLFINNKKKAFVLLTVSLVALAILIQLTVPTLFYRYRFSFNPVEKDLRDASKASRLVVVENAFKIIQKDNLVLLTGVGITKIGKVRVAASGGYVDAEEKSVGIGDNYFLQVLIGMGLIGFILFAWMLGSIFKESLNLFKKLDDIYLKSLAGAICAIVIIFCFKGFFAQLWELFPNNLYFWFLAGLLISIRKIAANKTEELSAEGRVGFENV